MQAIQRLYHLAESDNITSIMTHGLMSTERLLKMSRMNKNTRERLLRSHRTGNMRITESIIFRDQKPMPPAALLRALDDGLQPADWYALLNGFVFFWPDRDRLERQRRACRDRPQTLLTFDANALFDRFGANAFLSAINSGNARRKPARRGHQTFVPYETWLLDGWNVGSRSRPPAEVVFKCKIPTNAPFLIDIADV
jgi:hypothetical protein